jgi:hypothetical protein
MNLGGEAMNRWEIDEADWDFAKQAVRRELEKGARIHDTISYSDLVANVGYFSGPDSHALARMLGEINAEERPYKGQPLLLSAVVTHKNDKYPGVGFFTVAEDLGMSVPTGDEQQRIFWAGELDLVFEAYSRRGDR